MHLFRNVGQEKDPDIAANNIGKIRVKLSTDADIVGGKIQFPGDEELAVGAELDNDLAVEHLLRCIHGINFPTTGNGHG